MTTSTAEFDELAALIPKAVAASKKLLNDFTVAPTTTNEKLFALIVLCELVRKAESVSAMATARAYSGINIVLRAAIENYVDLVNLIAYPQHYPDYMVYLSLNQQRSSLQAMLDNPSSPFAQSIATQSTAMYGHSVEQALAMIKTQLEAGGKNLPRQFRERGDKTRKVDTREKLRFDLAGKNNEYDAVYRLLSNHVHGRLAVMLDGIRHEDTVRWPPREPDASPVGVDSMCAVLLESSLRIARKYQKPMAQLRNLKRERDSIIGQHVERMRKKYQQAEQKPQ